MQHLSPCSASSRCLRADGGGDACEDDDARDSPSTCDTACACTPPSATACAPPDAGSCHAPCIVERPLPPARPDTASELCRT